MDSLNLAQIPTSPRQGFFFKYLNNVINKVATTLVLTGIPRK